MVPIINENDTIATKEIMVGDNDNLSALVVTLIEADLLILLSHIKGLYTADPTQDPDARLIENVSVVDESIWDIAGGTSTPFGTGGMCTKIEAAQLVQRSGATMVIADGNEPDVLLRIMGGERIGTRFLPLRLRPATWAHAADGDLAGKLESRKRWILAGSQALGRVVRGPGRGRGGRHARQELAGR